MCFNWEKVIFTLNGGSPKLVNNFTYLDSSVSSTESDVITCLVKAWTAIERLSIIWKSDLSYEIKRDFFQDTVVWLLLYRCTTWTLTKCIEKRLDENCPRIVRVTVNKSWKPHPTPINKTIQIRWTRHSRHWWRSKDELISNVLWQTPLYMDVLVLADLQELTYSSSVQTYFEGHTGNDGC